jgi:hypothetical protein
MTVYVTMMTMRGMRYMKTIPKMVYAVSQAGDGNEWKVTHWAYHGYEGCVSTWKM